MLLGKLKAVSVGGILFFCVFASAYLSKPDRGGFKRCEEIFGLDSLGSKGLKISPLTKWSPFENPKFRMEIEESHFNDLRTYLYGQGYRKWEAGGLQYGSLDIGWDGSSLVQYSLRKFSGHVHIIAYDSTKHLIYAIVSQ